MNLAQCPFCGGSASLWMGWRVVCDKCDAEGPDFGEYEGDSRKHIDAWNTRAAPPASTLTDEQIKDELLHYRCKYFQDEDGDGLPLVDALAHAFGDTDITRAKHEIEMIVDAIRGTT